MAEEKDDKKKSTDKDPATDPAKEHLEHLRGEHPVDEPPPSTLGRPTPTQEELDKLARGERVELSPDGSPEQLSGTPQHPPRDLRREEGVPGANAQPPYEQPTPTQAQVDAIARGEKRPTAADAEAGVSVGPGSGSDNPEEQLRKAGFKKVEDDDKKKSLKKDDEDETKKKSSEAESGAPYKTRDAKPEGRPHVKKDDKK